MENKQIENWNTEAKRRGYKYKIVKIGKYNFYKICFILSIILGISVLILLFKFKVIDIEAIKLVVNQTATGVN